jgi:hypothetical protein
MIWFVLFIILIVAIWSEIDDYKEKKYGENYKKKSLNVNDAIKITESIGKKQDKFFEDIKVGTKSAFDKINNSLEESLIEQRKDHKKEMMDFLKKHNASIDENGVITYHNENLSKDKKSIRRIQKKSTKRGANRGLVKSQSGSKMTKIDKKDNIYSVVELASNMFSIGFPDTKGRFSQPGWFYTGSTQVKCCECGKKLEVFRKLYNTKAKLAYHYYALVCSKCLTIITPSDLPIEQKKQVYKEHQIDVYKSDKIIKNQSIVESSFKYPVKFLSIKDEFGEKMGDDIFDSLNRGVSILETEAQLKQYLFSHGKKHYVKMKDALVELLREEWSTSLSSEIEIIDYGCGQGIATVVLLNNLDANAFPIDNIKKIILIEPGKIALDRAVDFLKNSPKVMPVNKGLDDITIKDLETKKDTVKIHLFSNILDMGGKYFRIENLAKKIRSSQTGDNYFVCVSATNEDKLHKFTEEITQVKIKSSTDELLEDLSGSYNLKGKVIFSPNTILDTVKFISKDRSDIHNPSNSNRPWKRIHMVFKKEF